MTFPYVPTQMYLRMLISLCLLLMGIIGYNQQRVPPVQQGGSGNMTISPPLDRPSSTSGSAANSSAQLPSGTPNVNTNNNSITIVGDYSGSMSGAPLEAAKRSTMVLIDLIELWGDIYPVEIGQLHLQYIQFGGRQESNVLIPLQSLSKNTGRVLKQKIVQDQTYFHGTDYTSGINTALKELAGKNWNNKTIILTDAGDGGNGPDKQKDYGGLGDTKFILYGTSGTVGDWLNAVPISSEQQVNSEYEVMAGFVATLFEFVDDINKYLVRRGNKYVGASEPFIVDKHSKTATHDLIISRPDAGLVFDKIVDAQGNMLDTADYLLYDKAATFYQLRLKNSVPKGQYQLLFKTKDGNKRHIHYISFERCNISLDLEINPTLADGACLIENENINFRFRFWDVDQQEEITYPDFLAHTAFRYVIHNQVIQALSKDPKLLHFTKAFTTGSSGQYSALSSWNYNIDKLKNQAPPLSLVKEFCVAEDGRLVHLSYDTTQTWEGRRLVLQAKVDRTDPAFLQEISTIYVNTGQGQVLLKQTAPNRNAYEGSIDILEAKLYQLTIENRHPKYKLGFDKHTATQFEGRARYLLYEIEQRAYLSAKQQLSWQDKLSQAIESIKGAKHYRKVKQIYKGNQDILVANELPFAEALDEEIPIAIRLNKSFPDEQVQLDFKVKAGAYPQTDIRTGGWWGVFQSSSDIQDAIKADFSLEGPHTLDQSKLRQQLHLQKIAGDLYVEQPLQPMPSMEVAMNITIAIPGHTRQLTIPSKTLAFAITTSHWSRFWTQAERIGKWILLSLSVFISTLSLLLFLLYRRTLFIRKLQKWQNDIKHSSPEDFYALFPTKLKKAIQQYQQSNATNPALFPAGVEEIASVKNRRAFRYQLQQQQQNAFDKKQLKYWSMKGLEDLSNKVRQQHTDGIEWVFALQANAYREIRIVSFEADKHPNKEDCIRIRNNAETSYGDFIIKDQQLFFNNKYNIIYLQDKLTGEWQWIDNGSETPMETGQVIQFGPDISAPYFKALIYFDGQQLGVTFI